MAETPIDFRELATPFAPNEIEWRVGQCGKNSNNEIWCKVLAYVTNRAIMHRLDSVCGPANWRNEFIAGPGGGVLCGISIRVDGEWITKWDGAENTDIESVKGGLSDSMKRAAVQWGVGRYLYDLEEGWATVTPNRVQGANFAKTKDGASFYWTPPALPPWATPAGGSPHTPAPTPKPQNGNAPAGGNGNTITKDQGDALFELAKTNGINVRAIMDHLGVKRMGEITHSQYKDALKWTTNKDQRFLWPDRKQQAPAKPAAPQDDGEYYPQEDEIPL